MLQIIDDFDASNDCESPMQRQITTVRVQHDVVCDVMTIWEYGNRNETPNLQYVMSQPNGTVLYKERSEGEDRCGILNDYGYTEKDITSFVTDNSRYVNPSLFSQHKN